MKKWIVSALLASVMCTSVLTGCGNTSETSEQTEQQEANTEMDIAEKAYIVDGVTSEGFPWSNEDVEISFVGYYDNPDYFDKGMIFDVTNKSDHEIEFYTDHKLVNGSTIVGYSGIRINSGETGTLVQGIDRSELEAAKIDTINDIRIAFSVSEVENDTLTGSSYVTDEMNIQVTEGGENALNDSGSEVMNLHGVRVVFQGTENDEQGTLVKFFVENNSDRVLLLFTEDVTVDGEEAAVHCGMAIYPGGHVNTADYVTTIDSNDEYLTLEEGNEVTMEVSIADEDYTKLLICEGFSFTIE